MTKFQQFSTIIAWFGLAISIALLVGRSIWYRYGKKSPKFDIKVQLIANSRRRSVYFKLVSWPFAFVTFTFCWLWSGAYVWTALAYMIYVYTAVATLGLLLRIKRLLAWWFQGRKLYRELDVRIPDFGIILALVCCILGWTFVYVNWS